MKPTPGLRSVLLGISLLAAVNSVKAQTIQWSNTGTSTAWYTNTNWNPNTSSSQWLTSNIAQFNNTGTATSAGINMATASLSIGAIEVTSARTRALTIGNSSTTSSGTLTLNGTTVNSVNNVILRNASNSLLTLQNTQGSGDKTMNVVLGNATNNVILIEGSGGVTISSSISGTGLQLSRQGDGTGSLTLSGNNSFTAGLNYSGLGTLALQHSNAAGIGTITLASTQTGTTATMTVSGGINVANNIIMDAATGRNTLNSTSGSNTLSGNITVNNNSANSIVFQNQAAAGTTYTVGDATPNSTTITAATYSNTISFRATNAGALGVLNSRIDAPNASINANNNGIWTINSSGSSWALTSTSTNTSGFVLAAHDALATGARVEFNGSGGQINLNGYNQTVAGLGGTSNAGQIFNNSATTDSVLTLAGLTADRNYASAINDGTRKVSLVMNSSGRVQTLSGTNTYSGPTTVSAGTLYVAGALSNSTVTVEANGTIGRNDLTVGGGILGNGLTIEAGGDLDLSGATLGLNSAGVLSLTDGSLTLGNLTFQDLLGWNWANADVGTYELIDGVFSINWGSTAYLSPATAYDFGNGKKGYFTSGSLNVVVIPEPRAALLGGLGLLALLRRRRN